MRKIVFYSYRDIADLFRVQVSTVRNWKCQGLFKILGYRRLKGWNKKEAVVEEVEVKKLLYRKLVYPSKNKEFIPLR